VIAPAPRHRPTWRRRTVRSLALVTIRDAVLHERALADRGSELWCALGRCERALTTAARLADNPPE